MAVADSRAGTPISQASAIPYRLRDGRVEFCLITTIKRRRWAFPKGIIDAGETPEETALKEAFEEAGLHGRILGEPLGRYGYEKWGTTLTVTVMLMEVCRADQSWPEAELRQRRWATPAEALELLSDANLRRLFHDALDRTGGSQPNSPA